MLQMCKAQLAAALAIVLHPTHTSKVDVKAMEHGGNTVRGWDGLAEVQCQLQELPFRAISMCFEAVSLFPFLNVYDTCR